MEAKFGEWRSKEQIVYFCSGNGVRRMEAKNARRVVYVLLGGSRHVEGPDTGKENLHFEH